GLVEPLVAAVLGVVVLDERLSLLAWCGAALVLGALLVMVRVSRPVVSAERSAV
ncbi:MAG: EamA family transporter, partial [Nocardioidaceae bacterium]|nr:EamA family transporter [Nocardioidaceae bacterium]